MTHWISTLHAFHHDLGCSPVGVDTLWQNLPDAWRMWRILQDRLDQRLRASGAPLVPRCPCCLRTRVACGDGCFGLRLLKKAGAASRLLPPSLSQSIIVPLNKAEEAAADGYPYSNVPFGACEPIGGWKAEAETARDGSHYLINGVVAFSCEHSIALSVCPITSKGERYGIIYAALERLYYGWLPSNEPPPPANAVLEGKALGVIVAGSYDISCRINTWLRVCVHLLMAAPKTLV